MATDPVIHRIRAARHQISKECGHDARKLVEHYLGRQRGLTGRLLVPAEETVRDKKA